MNIRQYFLKFLRKSIYIYHNICYNIFVKTQSVVFYVNYILRCCSVDNKIELSKIKSDLEDNIGSKIRFASKRGRKQRIIRQGVIEGAYANVFVIKVDSGDEIEPAQRRISYSYADILTRNVELALCGK